uniref:Protein KRI1 homolog n=1 Tax=Oryzias latipes TaxID=8090 RepID=A0A3B3HR29_ORYLA
DDEDDDEEGGTSTLLTRRMKTQEEKLMFVLFLWRQKYLRDYWNNPQLEEKERFLRDYVLNKGYLNEEDDDEERCVVQEDVDDSEEEGESFLERQEDFERSYNFRFEEPDSERVKTYPRNIATSVRSKDDSRKRKREEVKERKQKVWKRKREQLKQLKRNEIMEKLKQLQELTGNEQLAFSQEDLEGDFDPKHHDRLMQVKDYAEEDYNGEKIKKKERKKKMKKEDLPLMGKKRKKSHFADVVTQKKPVFDPKEKTFEQYLDEYYKLDYEDIIDDLPCRFRYRQVVPNDFGLTTEEILSANDKELNRWCSLKKTCMFRSEKEELSDLKNYKIKAGNERKKKEILSSEEEEEILIPKKKIKTEAQEEADQPTQARNRTDRPKWSGKKQKRSGRRLLSAGVGVRIGGREFSRQRLKAYGLNPKRLYFRQLGRQRRKTQEKKLKQKHKE